MASAREQPDEAIETNKTGLARAGKREPRRCRAWREIPGNLAVMVFRNDYAVRMLAASVPEDANGKANMTRRAPSAVFAPYGGAELNAMASELGPVFGKIVRDATGG